jgi:hypothetical protein
MSKFPTPEEADNYLAERARKQELKYLGAAQDIVEGLRTQVVRGECDDGAYVWQHKLADPLMNRTKLLDCVQSIVGPGWKVSLAASFTGRDFMCVTLSAVGTKTREECGWQQ